MTEQAVVELIGVAVTNIVGVGTATYFGFRAAINGLKERSARIERTLEKHSDRTHEGLTDLTIAHHDLAGALRRFMHEADG